MNCSESQRLQTVLNHLLLELHHRGNASGLGIGPGPSMGMGVVPDPFVGREVTSAKGNDAYLYILLIMIFYACIAGGLILAYTRSRKLVEAKDEPPLACVAQQEWIPSAGASADPENGQGLLAEGGHQFASGRCLRWLRALSGSKSTAHFSLFISGPGSRVFTALPELALPEAQTMRRGQNPSRQGPGRRSHRLTHT